MLIHHENHFKATVALAWLLTVLAWPGLANSQETTSDKEAIRAFKIAQGRSPLSYLEERRDKLKMDVKIGHIGSADRNRAELELGTVYHYIGHIYEDKDDIEAALENHILSLDAHLRSPLNTSDKYPSHMAPFEHALSHVREAFMRQGGEFPAGLLRRLQQQREDFQVMAAPYALSFMSNRLLSMNFDAKFDGLILEVMLERSKLPAGLCQQ